MFYKIQWEWIDNPLEDWSERLIKGVTFQPDRNGSIVIGRTHQNGRLSSREPAHKSTGRNIWPVSSVLGHFQQDQNKNRSA